MEYMTLSKACLLPVGTIVVDQYGNEYKVEHYDYLGEGNGLTGRAIEKDFVFKVKE